jgi:beta-lactamase superfamily II metal-dependent hydrolase
MLTIPAFGETNVVENRLNKSARVWNFSKAKKESFFAYCTWLEENGYEKKELRYQDDNCFAAYAKADCGVFLSFFAGTAELRIVEEESCLYFSYTDSPRNRVVAPRITQLFLTDYGLSYVIRLSDGRLIVIDGGNAIEPDVENLMNTLNTEAEGEKPVIAAWIMTHPHGDHFHCFISFMDRYADEVVIEKFLFNFPEADDLEHYPKLVAQDSRFENSSALAKIPQMLAHIERTGAPTYMTHTGQRYQIGDAACEILSSMDDTIHSAKSLNAISLMIRMEIAGQVILWGTDCSFSMAKIPERWGSYLKADILQIPHHGFQCGEPEPEVRGYELINPKVCMLPVSGFNAYTTFCVHREGTHHLMRNMEIEELIEGNRQRVLPLPYHAPASAKHQLEQRVIKGLDNCGARTWIFTDLSTACPEDFEFSFLNTTHVASTVWIELFFAEKKQAIRHIKLELLPLTFKQASIVGEEADSESVYFNWMSLKTRGIPENAPFAARFTCEHPIVVSHKTHKESYRSTFN